MRKLTIFIFLILSILFASAQTIEEQVEKEGNRVFANAMVRNILIILGVLAIYFLITTISRKSKNKD